MLLIWTLLLDNMSLLTLVITLIQLIILPIVILNFEWIKLLIHLLLLIFDCDLNILISVLFIVDRRSNLVYAWLSVESRKVIILFLSL